VVAGTAESRGDDGMDIVEVALRIINNETLAWLTREREPAEQPEGSSDVR